MTETVSDDAPQHPATKVRTCHRHGPYEAEHLLGGVYMPCPTCIDESEATKPVEPERPKWDPEAARLRWAGVTKRFENATFSSYHVESDRQRAEVERIVDYAHNFRDHFKAGRSLVMVGRPGTGKTHLGFAILRHLLAASDKFTGRLVPVSELFRAIKSTWDRGSKKTEAQALAEFLSPFLLIIDEIGVQFDSQAESNLFYEIINGRYQAMLPTVVISNLSRNELIEVIGARSFDRLRENDGLIATFDWESHRGKKP